MTKDSQLKRTGRLPLTSHDLLILAGLFLFLFLAYAIYTTFFLSFGGPPRVQEIALDAVVGNRGQDEIWLNDGRGHFTLDEQRLGNGSTRFVFTADLNADGHLDIFMGEEAGGQAWFNDGAGNFTAGDQSIDYDRYDGVALGDVTGDGQVDVFVAGVESYQVWRNDGRGLFNAGPRARYR